MEKFGSFIVHCTVYTVLYTSDVAVGDGRKAFPPRNPGTIAKNGEQPRTQPAIRIDSTGAGQKYLDTTYKTLKGCIRNRMHLAIGLIACTFMV